MDRNLALEVVRVTEMAAIASAKLMGRGTKNESDQAAVDAMRKAFDTLDINGTVVIGEGERDEAPMLYIGEKVGRARPDSAPVDIALDGHGCLLNAPDTYMEKLAVGPRAKGAIDMKKSPTENLSSIAKAMGRA